jgi:hypothetical protein
VHGSFGWGLETFPDQRELADSFWIVLADRGGYNKAPAGALIGWPTDASDLLAALEDTAGLTWAASPMELWWSAASRNVQLCAAYSFRPGRWQLAAIVCKSG